MLGTRALEDACPWRYRVDLYSACCCLEPQAQVLDRITVFQSFGFARPAGQKSNKSNASDVQGPCSLGSLSLLAVWNDSPARLWRAVNAVGSDIDLRKGESRDLFPVSLLIAEDDLNPDPSIISSKINCVDVEGINSSFDIEESSGPAASLYRNQYHNLG